MNINWILSLFLLPLYYFIGPIIFGLITLLDGFTGSFTRHHIILFIVFVTFSYFNSISIFWIATMMMTFCVIFNYDKIVKYHSTLKRLTKNTLEMINLEKKLQTGGTGMSKLTNRDIVAIENTNKMFIYVDDTLKYLQFAYDNLKFYCFYFINELFSHVSHNVCNKVTIKCENINSSLNNTTNKYSPLFYENILAFYELLLNVQPIGKYFVNIQEYYNCGLILDAKNEEFDIDQLNNMNNLIEGIFTNMTNLPNAPAANTQKSNNQFDPMKFMASLQNFKPTKPTKSKIKK